MLQEIVKNSDSLHFFCGFDINADVKSDVEKECRQSDFFPSTHWSVVVAAGESQAEPEIAQSALAELCQILLDAALRFRAQPRIQRARCTGSYPELSVAPKGN